MMKHIKRIFNSSNKLKKYDVHFLENLADLLDSGFSLTKSIEFLMEQYDVIPKETKQECIERINNAEKLSEILKVLAFDNTVITQIAFSEYHGEVTKVLRESAKFLLTRRIMIEKLVKAIQYPIILLIIFIGMLVILNFTVIPQFKVLYDAMGSEVTGLVSYLTLFIEYLPTLVFVIVGVLVSAVINIYILNQFLDVQHKNKLMTRIPLLRYIFMNIQTFKLSREFGYFIQNGLEVKEIIELFKKQHYDLQLAYESELIETHLLKGDSLSEAVSKLQMIDSKLATFISHGEQNSSVGKELITFSEYIIDRLIMEIEYVTKRIQPIIFFVLGCLIICLYLVIVLPIFQMMSQI